MRFQCTHCGGILAIEGCEPGEAVACGHCGAAVAVPATRLSPGAIIGDFILREGLGEGGMGAVYLAHQISLARPAAVKVLHPRFAADEGFLREFLREARAAAAINHPNIVQAYAVGEDEGLHYFAMEYVPGHTLQQVLAHAGRLSPERVLDIALQVAGALDFAWRSQGLIHRDIKPDNIMLTAEGTAKLADLGLARRLQEVGSDGSPELYGTPQYIAPEHLLGSPGDTRSDIYALGATLYQALTGRFPYTGETPDDIAQAHLSQPLVPMSSLCADVPPGLARVVEVMLAKRPRDRYPDAAALLADLEAVRQGGEPAYVPAPGSQLPIDLASAEAVAISQGLDGDLAPPGEAAPVRPPQLRAARRRFTVGRGPQARSASKTTSLARGGAAAPVARASATGKAAPDRGARVGRLVLGSLGLVVFAVVVVTAWRVLGPRRVGGGEQAASGAAPPRRAAPGPAAALEEMREDIAAGLPPADARERIGALAPACAEDPALAAAFADLAAPYLEEDLAAARRPVREADLKRMEKMRAEAAARAADAARRAEQEAAAQEEQRRQAEEARRREEERGQRRAALSEKMAEVRARTVELCRANRFDEAIDTLVPLTVSQEDDVAAWARCRKSAVEKARQLLESIVNSEEQLAGLSLVVPGKARLTWKVSRIGFKDVELQWRWRTYSKGQRHEHVDTLEIPLAELSPYQLEVLTRKKWELDAREEAERQLLFGAYLLAREQFLSEARRRLETCGRPEAAELLTEVAALEPAWRRSEVDRLMEEARQCRDQGDKQGAAARAAYIQRLFPEEAESRKEELRDLTGEPKGP